MVRTQDHAQNWTTLEKKKKATFSLSFSRTHTHLYSSHLPSVSPLFFYSLSISPWLFKFLSYSLVYFPLLSLFLYSSSFSFPLDFTSLSLALCHTIILSFFVALSNSLGMPNVLTPTHRFSAPFSSFWVCVAYLWICLFVLVMLRLVSFLLFGVNRIQYRCSWHIFFHFLVDFNYTNINYN